MNPVRLRLLLVIGLMTVVSIAACTSSSSAPSSAPSATTQAGGTWTGTWTTFEPKSSPPCGRDENNVQMVLTQSGTTISGTMTWTITQSFFPPDVGKVNTQPITGTLSGSSMTLLLAGQISGSATLTADTMSGSFINGSCNPNPFSLKRQ